MKSLINLKRQAGVTLMEVIGTLAIIAAVIVGALSLYGNANASQTSTQMLKDLGAISAATKQFFMGQGTYGTAPLNAALITAQKIPATMSISGTTITTQINGTLTVTGATNRFTIALTNVPADVCSNLLTNSATGWSSVQVGSSAALTAFPVSPIIATAAAQCGGTAPFTITWTTVS